MARLVGVKLTKLTNNSVAVWWDVSGENWEPSHVRVQFCRFVDFKPSAPYVPPSQMRACTNFTTSSPEAEVLAWTTFLNSPRDGSSGQNSTSSATVATNSTTPAITTTTARSTSATTTAARPAAAMTNGMIPAAFLMIARNLEDFVVFDVRVHGIVRGMVNAGPVTTLRVTTGDLASYP
jgi:hypothetical protein